MAKKVLHETKLKTGHYKTAAVVVWCFDDRYTPALKKIAEDRGWEHFDLVKLAGGANTLLWANESVIEFIMWNITAGIDLHDAPHVMLMMHVECGACKAEHQETGLEWHDYIEPKLVKIQSLLRAHLDKNNYQHVTIELVLSDFDKTYQFEPEETQVAVH